MLQMYTRLSVADNSGAKEVGVIGVPGGSTAHGRFTRRTAGVGDRIKCSVKKALPNSSIKAGDLVDAVIVRTRAATRRADGSYVRFDSNACVLIEKDGNPRGSRVFGAVARELREKNYLKIVSLASEVV